MRKLKHFKTEADALAYLTSELLSTLRDDLGRMTNDKHERQHYTNDDRKEMRDKIADLEAIEDRVMLRPVTPQPKTPRPTGKALPKFSIQETCTYEIEAKSMKHAKALWLDGGPTENVWELMQKSFTGVTERSIEPQEPNANGELEEAESF